jgi:hypothetical protein|tara:strand:- start:199 stop:432 length:234 start_codon:yes stop_codon:yes gene_type:complete
MNYGTSGMIYQKGWIILMGPEFFQTSMGQRFYQKTMPDIANQLEKMNKNLEILTDLIRQSLDVDKELRDKTTSENAW